MKQIKRNRKKEIQKMLRLIKSIWLRYPELRFGQLVENIGLWMRESEDHCIFYITDNVFLNNAKFILSTGCFGSRKDKRSE